jgi:hypothetical protein
VCNGVIDKLFAMGYVFEWFNKQKHYKWNTTVTITLFQLICQGKSSKNLSFFMQEMQGKMNPG